MKTILLAATLLAATCNEKNTPPPDSFEAGIYFGSMCCGTANDNFLKPIVEKYADRIRTYKIVGCGKEGEFRVLFSAPSLPENEMNDFVKELTSLVEKQDAVNRAENATIGRMNIERMIGKEQYEFCRDSIKAWKQESHQ